MSVASSRSLGEALQEQWEKAGHHNKQKHSGDHQLNEVNRSLVAARSSFISASGYVDLEAVSETTTRGLARPRCDMLPPADGILPVMLQRIYRHARGIS